MSKFEDRIFKLLKQLFPYAIIKRQLYVKYGTTKLFFDFYIKNLNLYIECQGDQHYKYTQFFHGSVLNYREARKRDKLKSKFVGENNAFLASIPYKPNITKEELLEMIHHVYKDT